MPVPRGLNNMVKKQHFVIILMIIVIAILLTISGNDNFCITIFIFTEKTIKIMM